MRYVIEVRRAVLIAASLAVSTYPASLLAQAPPTSPAQVSTGQPFPVKPVRYVVPFGAGGSPDLVARVVTERLSRLWGHQVIVENRAGVAGVLGTAFVAKSPPDGYTLIQCNIASSAIGVTLFAKMPYDQLRDIAPIARLGLTPNIITVHPSMPVKSLKELIAYAKRHPGKLSYASGQVGTSPQLSMELVKLVAKIDIVNIPYKVGAQGITDNIAGQVPVGISNFPASVAPVQSKRLRPLAVTSAMRVSQLPDVPTVQEAGLAGIDVSSWQGVCAPAAVPAALLDKLNSDINSVLRIPEVQQRMEELVMVGAQTTREEFDHFIRAEITRWAKVIKDAGIQPQ